MITTFLLATVYVLAPGPVNVAIVRYSVQDGFRSGLAVSLGALAGDALYALLVFSGMSVFLNHLPLQILLTVGGVVVLFYMGVQALRPSMVQLGQPMAEPVYAWQQPSITTQQAFRNGVLLVIANPLGAVFWSTLATTAAVEPGYRQLNMVIGFFGIATLLSVLMVVAVSQFKVLLTPRGLLGISRLCGVVLIGLGLRLGMFLLELV